MLRIRDEWTIDQVALNDAGNEPAHFVARRILVHEDVRFIGPELVLMADHIEFANHSINADGLSPTKSGADGAMGFSAPYGVPNPAAPGGDGHPGGRGVDGEGGRRLRVYAYTHDGFKALTCRGAPGGHGGAGGRGGSGYYSGWGGNGGQGGDGGNGGSGGDLLFFTGPDGWVDPKQIDERPGVGGAGGAGGLVGFPSQRVKKLYLDRKPGDEYLEMIAAPGQQAPPKAGFWGDYGDLGQNGNRRSAAAASLSEFYAMIRQADPALAGAWGAFRARQAEWLFRTASDDPARSNQALREARAALELLPAPAKALFSVADLATTLVLTRPSGGPLFERHEDHLVYIRPPFGPLAPSASTTPPDAGLVFVPSSDENRRLAERVLRMVRFNLTPFGLAWDHDPRLGFEHYDKAMQDILHVLNLAVVNAEQRLFAKLDVAVISQVIGLIRTDAAGRLIVVAKDQEVVAAKQAAVQIKLTEVQEKWTLNQAEQSRRRVEMEAEKVRNDVIAFAKTALAVASLISGGFGAVAALPAVYDSMMKVTALVGTSGTGIVEDFFDFSKGSLKPEFAAAGKSGKAFFDETEKVFSAVGAIQKAATSVADEKLAKLLEEQAKLVMERGKLAAEAGQVSLELDVVAARKQTSALLEDVAVRTIAASGDTEAELATLSMLLLAQIRLYADTLHRYHFQSARALQRWLFDESRLALFCAYGWVDPSVEIAFTEAAAPGLPAQTRNQQRQEILTRFLGSLQNTTSRFDFAGLRVRYHETLETLNSSTITFVLTAAQVNKLSQSGQVSIRILANSLPASVACETHVEDVQILDTAGNRDVELSLGTGWSVTMRDGEIRTGEDQERQVLVRSVASQAVLDSIVGQRLTDLRAEGPAARNAFWACSPLRSWTLTIRKVAAPTAGASPRRVKVVLVLTGQARPAA